MLSFVYSEKPAFVPFEKLSISNGHMNLWPIWIVYEAEVIVALLAKLANVAFRHNIQQYVDMAEVEKIQDILENKHQFASKEFEKLCCLLSLPNLYCNNEIE